MWSSAGALPASPRPLGQLAAVLALARAASADYVLQRLFQGGACGGAAGAAPLPYASFCLAGDCGFAPSAARAGCSIVAGGNFSLRLACANGSAASLLYFEGPDCGGAPFNAQPWPTEFGCVAASGGRQDSRLTTCAAGAFPTPAGAALQLQFPPGYDCANYSLVAPSAVLASPLGACLAAPGPGAAPLGQRTTCNATAIALDSFADASCAGAAAVSQAAPLGCRAADGASSGPLVAVCSAASASLTAAPQVGFVAEAGQADYSFATQFAAAPATFSLQLLAGAQAFFVIGSDAAGPAAPNCLASSTYFADSSAQVNFPVQSITVGPGDTGFCAGPPCLYRVSVCGHIGGAAEFAIAAAQQAAPGQTATATATATASAAVTAAASLAPGASASPTCSQTPAATPAAFTVSPPASSSPPSTPTLLSPSQSPTSTPTPPPTPSQSESGSPSASNSPVPVSPPPTSSVTPTPSPTPSPCAHGLWIPPGSAGTCRPCPAGTYYSPAFTALGKSCVDCPVGFFSPFEGATSPDVCRECAGATAPGASSCVALTTASPSPSCLPNYLVAADRDRCRCRRPGDEDSGGGGGGGSDWRPTCEPSVLGGVDVTPAAMAPAAQPPLAPAAVGVIATLSAALLATGSALAWRLRKRARARSALSGSSSSRADRVAQQLGQQPRLVNPLAALAPVVVTAGRG